MSKHKPHRKPVIARKANRPRVQRWLIRLDRIFLRIELMRKEEKKRNKGE